ncbi:MAG: hypothetical protein LBB27_00330 [Tannerellaceae bacterium]|jgi:tetratricopeptide (TPR) repeat protein|nr:hypothetical protein [Tannerellaceae bacterium]
MATQQQKTPEVDVLLSKSEAFIEKNSRKLLYGVGGVAAIIALIVAIQHLYLIPREQQAAVALFRGEQFFQEDSFSLALNGNGADFEGMAYIADHYGSTASGNLAKAYAGICSFHLGDYEGALKYLKGFDASDRMAAPVVTGLIGDCYANLGEVEKAIGFFEKAARQANNDLISPLYLKKAGIAYEHIEKYEEAAKAYAAIKEKYYTSPEADDIEKYITRATLRSSH